MTQYIIKKKVNEEVLDDILESGLEGISYWADKVEVVGGIEDDKQYVHLALKDGRYIRIHDIEENKWHKLTLKKLINGLSLSDDFDFANYDMYDAEQVIQLAIFGKLVYA